MLKRWMTIAASGVLGLGLMAGAALAQDTAGTTPPARKKAPVARQRQKNQQKRIAEGVESGQLTPKERAKIQHKQNQESRKIYREKHDNQTAPPVNK